MASPLKVGIAGLATVGSAVLRLIQREKVALAVRCGRLDRGDFLVGRRHGVAPDRPVHAQLRVGLPERALGAREREVELAGLQADQRLPHADLRADFDEHLADHAANLGTYFRLIGRKQVAGELNLALHGDALGFCRPNRNRRGRPTASLRARLAVSAGGDHVSEKAGNGGTGASCARVPAE